MKWKCLHKRDYFPIWLVWVANIETSVPNMNYYFYFKNTSWENSLAVWWLGLLASVGEGVVSSMVREWRSRMLCSAAKKKKAKHFRDSACLFDLRGRHRNASCDPQPSSVGRARCQLQKGEELSSPWWPLSRPCHHMAATTGHVTASRNSQWVFQALWVDPSLFIL